MLKDPEMWKNGADAAATTSVLAAVLGLLPDLAMALTVLWFGVRLYGGVMKERHMRKVRKYELARLEREAKQGATVAPADNGE